MRRRRTEIAIELEEIFVIRGRRSTAPAWCDSCANQVQMLTPDQAATIAGLSPRLIYRWIEAGRIHFSETAEGGLFVCQSSLTKLNQREGNLDAQIE